MNRRKFLIIFTSSLAFLAVGFNLFNGNNSGNRNYGRSLEKLPNSIRYIVQDIGIKGLNKLRDLKVNKGPFEMIEVGGYLIEQKDWQAFLNDEFF